jgi:acetyl esterase/lipase
MIDDLGAATGFLQKEKMVDRKKIFFAGASLGANVALNFASLTRSNRPLVLLSPGQNYQEITTDEAIVNVKEAPVLLMTSITDRYAYLSCQRMKELSPHVALWCSTRLIVCLIWDLLAPCEN